jgi:hypothetical protein
LWRGVPVKRCWWSGTPLRPLIAAKAPANVGRKSALPPPLQRWLFGILEKQGIIFPDNTIKIQNGRISSCRLRVHLHEAKLPAYRASKKIISQEEGTTLKNWGGKLPVALAWPNSYRVGMSSLALHVLYRIFNDEPDVVCERVFFGDQQAPRRTDPIISLESRRPLDEFAVVAFTISYEMDYFNVIEMLRRAGIPLFAEERDENWPLLIAGGPAVYTNPEPWPISLTRRHR